MDSKDNTFYDIDSLQRLSELVRCCEEEMAEIQRKTVIITTDVSSKWKGATAEAFNSKMEELLVSAKQISENIDITRHILSDVTAQMVAEIEANGDRNDESEFSDNE